MELIWPGRQMRWAIAAWGLAIAVGFASLSACPTASAQSTATVKTSDRAPELQCTSTPVRNDPVATDTSKCQKDDRLKCQKDPFLGQLNGPSLPAGLLPINAATRD